MHRNMGDSGDEKLEQSALMAAALSDAVISAISRQVAGEMMDAATVVANMSGINPAAVYTGIVAGVMAEMGASCVAGFEQKAEDTTSARELCQKWLNTFAEQMTIHTSGERIGPDGKPLTRKFAKVRFEVLPSFVDKS